jgi:hypothetical protein
MKWIRLAVAICIVFFIFLTSNCIKTVSFDETKKIAESADYIRPQGQIPLWQTPLDDMVIESMTVLPGNKLMVSTSALGKDRTLRNKEFLILDSSKGSILWRIPKKASIEYTYTLPVIEPIVIIEERSPKKILYQALGPDYKSVRWEKRIKGGTGSSAVSQGDLIISSQRDEKTMEIIALNLMNGKQKWMQSIPFSGQEIPSLLTLPEAEEILVYGGVLAAISPRNGQILWTRRNISVAPDKAFPRIEGDSLYAADKFGVIFKLKLLDGSTAWDRKVQGSNVTTILASGEKIFIVSQGRSSTNSIISCIESKNGTILWQYDAQDSLHSLLYEDEASLNFTAGNNFIKLDKTKGTSLIKMTLPFENFEKANLPERIRLTSKSIIIANESNIVSFTLRRLSNLFEHHIESIREYAEVQRLIQLNQRAMIGGVQVGPAPTIPSLPPVSRTYLDSVISHRKVVFQRTASVFSSPRSSNLSRQLASQERIGTLQSEIGALKRQHRAERRRANLELTISIVNLAATIIVARLEARMKAVDIGALEQAKFQLKIAGENYSKLFQGVYYVRPYRSMIKGSGITMINTISGERTDYVVSPLNYSLEYTGQAYAVDFENNRIYISGIGLDPKFYKSIEIVELGKKNIDYLPSVMAFELKLPQE